MAGINFSQGVSLCEYIAVDSIWQFLKQGMDWERFCTFECIVNTARDF